MRSKTKAVKTKSSIHDSDEETNSDQPQPTQLRDRKRNTKPSTSQNIQSTKQTSSQTRRQKPSNTPIPKHISKSQPSKLPPKNPTKKTISQPYSRRAKKPYVPQLRSSPRALMKIFSEISADLKPEHKDILKKTPFRHIFEAIIDNKVSDCFITKTDKHICQIFAAFVNEESGFNIAGKMMNLKTRDIQLIMGIRSGASSIQKTKSQREDWALHDRRFKHYKRLNLPALKEEIKKVVKKTDDDSLNDFASMVSLLLIETLLFTTTGNSINLTYARYCQSLESLCAINWAALAKEMLISEIGSKKDNKPLTVTGCSIVMLYWLCECTSIIQPAKEFKDAIPRLLKWNLSQLSIAMNKTPLSAFKPENIKTDPLMPTETEINELNLSESKEDSIEVYLPSQISSSQISQPSPTVTKGKGKEKIVEIMDAVNEEEEEEEMEKEAEKDSEKGKEKIDERMDAGNEEEEEEEKEDESEEECENERMQYDDNFLESQEVDDSLEEGVDPTGKTCPTVNLHSETPVHWEKNGDQDCVDVDIQINIDSTCRNIISSAQTAILGKRNQHPEQQSENINSVELNNSNLLNKLLQLENANSQMTEESLKNIEENQQLQNKLKALQAEMLKRQIESVELNNSDLPSKLLQLENANSQMREESLKHIEENQHLQNRLKSLQAEMLKRQIETEERVKSLEGTNDRLSNELKKFEEKVTLLEGANEKLKEDKDQFSQLKKDNEERVKTLEDANANLKEEKDQISKLLEEKVMTLKQTENQITLFKSSDERVKTLVDANQKLKEEIDQLTKLVGENEIALKKQDDQITQLKSSEIISKQTIEDLKNTVNTQRETTERIKNRELKLINELADLKETKNREIALLKKEINDKRTELTVIEVSKVTQAAAAEEEKF